MLYRYTLYVLYEKSGFIEVSSFGSDTTLITEHKIRCSHPILNVVMKHGPSLFLKYEHQRSYHVFRKDENGQWSDFEASHSLMDNIYLVGLVDNNAVYSVPCMEHVSQPLRSTEDLLNIVECTGISKNIYSNDSSSLEDLSSNHMFMFHDIEKPTRLAEWSGIPHYLTSRAYNLIHFDEYVGDDLKKSYIVCCESKLMKVQDERILWTYPFQGSFINHYIAYTLEETHPDVVLQLNDSVYVIKSADGIERNRFKQVSDVLIDDFLECGYDQILLFHNFEDITQCTFIKSSSRVPSNLETDSKLSKLSYALNSNIGFIKEQINQTERLIEKKNKALKKFRQVVSNFSALTDHRDCISDQSDLEPLILPKNLSKNSSMDIERPNTLSVVDTYYAFSEGHYIFQLKISNGHSVDVFCRSLIVTQEHSNTSSVSNSILIPKGKEGTMSVKIPCFKYPHISYCNFNISLEWSEDGKDQYHIQQLGYYIVSLVQDQLKIHSLPILPNQLQLVINYKRDLINIKQALSTFYNDSLHLELVESNDTYTRYISQTNNLEIKMMYSLDGASIQISSIFEDLCIRTGTLLASMLKEMSEVSLYQCSPDNVNLVRNIMDLLNGEIEQLKELQKQTLESKSEVHSLMLHIMEMQSKTDQTVQLLYCRIY